MDDYDWKVLGDEWTDWSHHEDTGVTDGSIIDLRANFSFFLLFSCYATGLVSAQVADPSEPEPMDEKNLTKTVVKVAHGYVVVDEWERSIFIDYRNGALFNLPKESNDCQQFDISDSIQVDNFVLGQIDLFGEFKFIEEAKDEKEKDQRYSTAKVQ